MADLTTPIRTYYFVRTDKSFCPNARPTARHHRRSHARPDGAPANPAAAASSARAAAIGAATGENYGHAAPAGVVPPADARGAAARGGSRARTCGPADRSLLRPHRDVVRHRAEDAGWRCRR